MTRLLLLLLPLVAWVAGSKLAPPAATGPAITWQRMVLDEKFRGEGAAIVDCNNDGKPDVVVGDYWYAAPDWKRHVLRPSKQAAGYNPHAYSDAFCIYPGDFNADGWMDVIVIPFPGAACFWYENSRDPSQPWKAHPVWRSACNETPIFVDLFKDGKPVLVMGIQPEGQMCWFAPSGDGGKPWEPKLISEPKAPGTNPFSHGLGAGDVNGDGRLDVIVKEGWWEQPAEGRTAAKPWAFHRAPLGEDCANMYALDLDGDGLADVVSSSAHRRGVWWYRQRKDQKPEESFQRFDILGDVTQTHALCQADVNGDGLADFITGKRWWAHGPRGDIDPNGKSTLYWIEARPGSPPTFAAHLIDDNSGIGTQFAVADANGDGLPDVAVANKKGVFLFLQQRPK